MPGLVALNTGTCSGEGVCVAANMHDTTACNLPPCPPANSSIKILPLAKMISTCYWPPSTTTHLNAATAVKTIKVNGVIPLVDGDILTYHKSTCTNKVTNLWTSGDSCTKPVIADCLCGLLTKEDMFDRGHDRIVKSTATTVYFEGKRVACVGDPLGPPCTAKISQGSANVTVGK